MKQPPAKSRLEGSIERHHIPNGDEPIDPMILEHLEVLMGRFRALKPLAPVDLSTPEAARISMRSIEEEQQRLEELTRATKAVRALVEAQAARTLNPSDAKIEQ